MNNGSSLISGEYAEGTDIASSGHASGVGFFVDPRNPFGRDDLVGATDLAPRYRMAWSC
jgi:hypothetical protein